MSACELVGHLRNDVAYPLIGRDAVDVLGPAVRVGKVERDRRACDLARLIMDVADLEVIRDHLGTLIAATPPRADAGGATLLADQRPATAPSRRVSAWNCAWPCRRSDGWFPAG